MTQYHARGDFSISTSGSGSSTEMQLTSKDVASTCNYVYKSESPQSTTGGGFTLSYQFKVDSSSEADEVYAFIGHSTSGIPTSGDSTSTSNGMIITFSIYTGNSDIPAGIYLRKTTSSTNTKLATYTSGISASGNWESFTVQYTPSSTNTWKVGNTAFLFLVYYFLSSKLVSVRHDFTIVFTIRHPPRSSFFLAACNHILG